jgi:3-oxoacyl-[acyl-carrier-protein] synthase II
VSATSTPLRYQKRKDVRRGTRAGSIGIYCAHEAWRTRASIGKRRSRRVGVYIGVTEHGNVETENEIYEIKAFDYDTSVWSHHHNPRTVANNPAGEVTLNMGITGPHYTIGAACAAGNAGLIQAAQMLRLGRVRPGDRRGRVESIHTFGIFASFNSQGALATHDDPTKASRPFDRDRNGIVVAEGGCLYVLERLSDAEARGAKIYGEIAGYAMNSDASDFVLPNPKQQARVHELALKRAGLTPSDIDIVSTHATAPQRRHPGVPRPAAVFGVFADHGSTTPRASSATRWARPGRWSWRATCRPSTMALPPTINVDELDPECALKGLVLNEPRETGPIDDAFSTIRSACWGSTPKGAEGGGLRRLTGSPSQHWRLRQQTSTTSFNDKGRP